MERAPTHQPNESGYLDGKRYNIAKVRAFAECIPTEIASLEEFRFVISKDNDSTYVIDDGPAIRPWEIVENWETMRNDPRWAKYVASIMNVDLEVPILVSHTGHVLDGQHRVIKAFIQGRTEIKVKHLPPVLPRELEMAS